MKFLKFILIAIIFPWNLNAQTDKEIFDSCIGHFHGKSFNLADIAAFFINKPYKAATLEINPAEELVVNLREFDCTTLVESCIAIYLTLNDSVPNFDSFKKNLTKVRYRNGIIDGYTSRLHYASEWIKNNEDKNILTDISEKTGGDEIFFQLNFMSSHTQLYPQLSSNNENITEIKKTETELNKLAFHYIPKKFFSSSLNKIHSGDVILFVTSVKGLDISHMGISSKGKKQLTFIHASQKYKKVVINPESLYEYCMSNKNNVGIIICRIN